MFCMFCDKKNSKRTLRTKSLTRSVDGIGGGTGADDDGRVIECFEWAGSNGSSIWLRIQSSISIFSANVIHVQ